MSEGIQKRCGKVAVDIQGGTLQEWKQPLHGLEGWLASLRGLEEDEETEEGKQQVGHSHAWYQGQ